MLWGMEQGEDSEMQMRAKFPGLSPALAICIPAWIGGLWLEIILQERTYGFHAARQVNGISKYANG